MTKVLVALVTVCALAAGAVYAYRQGFLARWAARAVTSPQPAQGGVAMATSASGGRGPASDAGAAAAIGVAPAVPPADSSVVTGSLTNIAASTFGGHIARMTGEFGPGSFGRHLIDGNAASTWKPKAPVPFPQEIVFSFYEREPALVSSIIVSLPPEGSPPADIEIWTSTESATAGFVKAAARTLPSATPRHVIPVGPVEARFVKLIVKSSTTADALDIGEVQVMEPQRPGYTSAEGRPLRARTEPAVTRCTLS